MIPFDFDYFKPKTIQETTRLFHSLAAEKKTPMYYSGGTEIITLGRLNLIYTDAAIDINALPEFHTIRFHEKYLVMGAGVSLTKVEEENPFPLLSKTVSEIADRTARNKISLGGNICGNIYYREAVLPLLISDSLVGVAGRAGLRYHPINKVFNREIQLQKGDFLFHILIDRTYIESPFVSIKRRQQWNVGYPLVTVCALKKDEEVRMAFSGVCPFPFRSIEMEEMFNDKSYSFEDRVRRSLQYLPKPILDDVEGSSEYRIFVLQHAILDALHELEGGPNV
ncbi:xanthine dehydrogenase [Bacillus subtilis]|uniref:FAD binding domain-containing protein n=1 Tax=Bacillus sp. LJBS06 TaxID=2809036 RepID=UPI0011CC02A7|nr:FAD binding domain-containing protein [Bacillus sp. LJBS06]QRZ91528.1 FAD binding domain-containing protein [Bacillus sp. LJBS06]TXF73391.1 xanthine dehydrogenase [Bacillus subtilis]